MNRRQMIAATIGGAASILTGGASAVARGYSGEVTLHKATRWAMVRCGFTQAIFEPVFNVDGDITDASLGTVTRESLITSRPSSMMTHG